MTGRCCNSIFSKPRFRRVALSAADRHWELAAWARNLGDENYIVDAFDNGVGNGIRLYGEPRTYGLTFTYRWNE